MSVVHCNRGHANASGNRFCSVCGEKLSPAEDNYLGLILGDRYRIVQELGYGGFGRTYLAEDLNRFNEPCVLKEFVPQVRGTFALQKSEELFEREAGTLYKLQHPQIPRFRELFRATLEGQGHLFLVQDYIEGRTYRQLLEARRIQGLFFSELEVRQLLEQLLPVLRYLHQSGVIHRDISPDNLILRASDQLPVLIDFGGVKQIAVEATSMYMEPGQEMPPATRLGKVGYAPEEQMHDGIVSPQSDLYALAATVLVLLTGQEPIDCLGYGGRSPTWQQLPLSPHLTAILSQMLAPQSDRYPSAQAVLQDLCVPHPNLQGRRQEAEGKRQKAEGRRQSLSPDSASPSPYPPTAPISPISPSRKRSLVLPLFFLGFILASAIGIGWWTRDRWLPLLLNPSPPGEPEIPPEEQPQQNTLESRSQALGVNYQWLINLTNATFYERYPDQEGHTLSDSEADAELRAVWAGIADEWLTTLEQNVSTAARQKLGSYTDADRNQWKQEVNQLYVGSRSLYDLTDAKFFDLFPQQRGKEFIDQPIGQVWQAIASDQVRALQAGKNLESLQFEAGTYSKQASGSLAPGEGRVYTANLAEGQIMRVNLQAPPQTTQLSLYLPRPTSETPFLLEDSAELTWTGRLPQSGYYEVVVINAMTEPIAYQLNLAVDNVTSTPVEPEKSEVPEAKD